MTACIVLSSNWKVLSNRRPEIPVNFHLHPHFEAQPVYQQPSMEAFLSNWIVMPRGTTFGVLEGDTCIRVTSSKDFFFWLGNLALRNVNALTSKETGIHRPRAGAEHRQRGA